jgi:hypothetical protein
MALQYRNLEERTRKLMLAEIELDVAAGTLFLSDNLNPKGRLEYPDLIRTAAREGTDATLAEQIRSRLNSHEKPRKLKSGEFSKPPVDEPCSWRVRVSPNAIGGERRNALTPAFLRSWAPSRRLP